MSTPTIYRSTDTDAPVFIPSDTKTWMNMLKACLVYGYTGKTGAGWTVSYEDTTSGAIVFKQGGGNGRYLKLGVGGYQFNGYSQDIRYVSAQSFIYMTDINTGTGAWPPLGNTNIWAFANQTNANSASPQNWTIVATNKFVLIYLRPTLAWSPPGYHPKCVFFFGDFKSNVVGDVYNTVLSGYDLSIGGGYNCCFATNNINDVSPFTWDLSVTPPNSTLWIAGPYYQQIGVAVSARLTIDNHFEGGSYAGNGLNFFPDFCTNTLNLTGINIQETWSGTMSIRGTLPGIFVPCFSPEHENGTVIAGTGVNAGKTFLSLNNNEIMQGTPSLYIQLQDWND